MAVTMNDVKAFLDAEEPDYAMAVNLGADAHPHLQALVSGDDPMLASKAAYLAALIGGDGATAVVEVASRSGDAAVRVAAAAGLAQIDAAETAERLVADLLTDEDSGVRKQALRATQTRSLRGVKAQVMRMADGDHSETLRELAAEIAGGLPD